MLRRLQNGVGNTGNIFIVSQENAYLHIEKEQWRNKLQFIPQLVSIDIIKID